MERSSSINLNLIAQQGEVNGEEPEAEEPEADEAPEEEIEPHGRTEGSAVLDS